MCDCDLLTRSLEQSCFVLASLRPATVFARLPNSELMQLSNTHSLCSSAREPACEFNQIIKPAFNLICLPVYTHRHMMGVLTRKSILFHPYFLLSTLPQGSFGRHKCQYHCNIKESLFFFLFFESFVSCSDSVLGVFSEKVV